MSVRRLKLAVASCLPLVCLVGACASVTVDSVPSDAEVGILLTDEAAMRVIGRTPFKAEVSELEALSNDSAITLVVRRPGYQTQQFQVSSGMFSAMRITPRLLPDLPRNFEGVNRIVALVLRGQRYLIERRYAEAVKTAEDIKRLNENVASAYEIEGSAHLLSNRLREAREAWTRVLEIEPDNAEAKSMLSLVESKLGIKRSKPLTPGQGAGTP
jgi:tetratricopeptide (TPR) repeat protein